MEGNQINDSYRINTGRRVDYRENTWENIAAAKAGITGDQRIEGQFIPVKLPSGIAHPHHWVNGELIPFDGRIDQEDTVLIHGFTLNEVDSEVTLDGTKWRIFDIVWMLQNIWNFPIPAPDAGGLIRIDRIKLNSSTTPQYMVGDPGISAVAKPLIYGELLLADITVSLAGIEVTPAPVSYPDGEVLYGPAAPLDSQGKAGDSYTVTEGADKGKEYKKKTIGGVTSWVLEYTPESGASARFGIEDNTGVQARDVDMDGFYFDVYNAEWGEIAAESEDHSEVANVYVGLDNQTGTDGKFITQLGCSEDGVGTLFNVKASGVSVTNADETKTLLPKVDGTLVASVNGIEADASGNVEIELGGDTSGLQPTAEKDASGGYAGLTLFKINFKNALNTFTSFFTNANTAARTYTFPDKTGTVAMLDDIPVGGDAVPQAFIPNTANVVMSGDSYTVGGVGPTSVNNSHPYILKSRYNFNLENLAQNGTGVFQAIKNLYANSTAIPTADDAFFFMSGFNDLRRAGGGNPTLEKIKGAARVYFANAFAKSITIANDAAVTKAGTWTTTNAATVPAKAIQQYTNSIVLSSTVGSTLTYTFTGDNMFVSILGLDGGVTFKGGTVTITVDGVLRETFVTQGKTDGLTDALGSTNEFSPNGVYLKGLGDGSHTCVLAVTAIPSGGGVYVDYFGTLEAPINSKPVLVGNYPYMSAYGYTQTAPYINASDAVMDAGNAALESVVNEFPYYPVYLADINANFNTATHVAGDGIHPNDAGARAIADTFSALITPTAKSPNIAGFVPYTGANATVNLGTQALSGGTITGSNQASFHGVSIGKGAANGTTNIAIGASSLASASAAGDNVAVGYESLMATTGTANTALGSRALKAVVAANHNTAIGTNALTLNTAALNTAVGSQVLKAVTSGASNTVIGANAATVLQGGARNVGVGASTLESTVSGNDNVNVGYLCGGSVGSDNTCIGSGAGYGNTGSSSVFIGKFAGLNILGSNLFYLANGPTNHLLSGSFATATKHIKHYGGIATFRRAVADVAATIAISDYLIAYTSLTATRAVTLPTASTVSGSEFVIKDEAGTAGTNAITIVGTVDGVANPTAINTNYGKYKIYSNGTSWFTV